MKSAAWIVAIVLLGGCVGCAHRQVVVTALHATANGAALAESSGGKQVGAPGTALAQPLVVTVNDKSGNSVTGALVSFSGPAGVAFDPPQVLTDTSGQASTLVTLGGVAGRYELTASSNDAGGKAFTLSVVELAAGYQQQVGIAVTETYCVRCHDPESTTQRVSNYDNLTVKPHAFTEGDALNKLSDADLTAIINHGGTSMNLSAEMPPYGATLTKPEIQAVIAYIRLVSDPPYKAAGVVYAKR